MQFHICDMLAKVVLFRIFYGKDTVEFPFQFGDQFGIFYNIVSIITADVDSIYVLIYNRDSITDKKD